jgi:hypothetical protein
LSAINRDYRLLRSGKTGFRAGAQYKEKTPPSGFNKK